LLSLDLERSRTRLDLGDEHRRPRPPEELYDLVRDPNEAVDLAGDPGHAEVRAEPRAALEDWMYRTADPLSDGPTPLPPPRSRAVDALPALTPPAPRPASPGRTGPPP
jgi:hypothetical protein